MGSPSSKPAAPCAVSTTNTIKKSRPASITDLVAATVQQITDLVNSKGFREKVEGSRTTSTSDRICEFHIPCTDVGLIGSEFRDIATLIVTALENKFPPEDSFQDFYLSFHQVDRTLCPEFVIVVWRDQF